MQRSVLNVCVVQAVGVGLRFAIAPAVVVGALAGLQGPFGGIDRSFFGGARGGDIAAKLLKKFQRIAFGNRPGGAQWIVCGGWARIGLGIAQTVELVFLVAEFAVTQVKEDIEHVIGNA